MPADATRILYVCDLNAHGGTQTHLIQILEEIDRRRFCPYVAALTLHPALADRLARLEVETCALDLAGAWRPDTLRATASIASRVRRDRFGLIHGFLPQGNVITAWISLLSGVPCITSVRNMDERTTRWQAWCVRRAHARAWRVVYNAAAVREAACGRGDVRPDRAVVIPNGVAVPGGTRGPAAGEGPRVLCVASLTEKKDHALLIEAWAAVVSRLPDARLGLAGDGPLRGRIEETLRARDLGGSVSLLGHRDDLPHLYAQADLVVLASREEGMPNALLEAMAHAIPVVATDVGGTGEVIEEGVTGHLVAPRAPDLAAAMIRVLEDPPLARRMGEAGRRRVQDRFSLRAMVEAYESLYRTATT